LLSRIIIFCSLPAYADLSKCLLNNTNMSFIFRLGNTSKAWNASLLWKDLWASSSWSSSWSTWSLAYEAGPAGSSGSDAGSIMRLSPLDLEINERNDLPENAWHVPISVLRCMRCSCEPGPNSKSETVTHLKWNHVSTEMQNYKCNDWWRKFWSFVKASLFRSLSNNKVTVQGVRDVRKFKL
jgi:hypothetical protein